MQMTDIAFRCPSCREEFQYRYAEDRPLRAVLPSETPQNATILRTRQTKAPIEALKMSNIGLLCPRCNNTSLVVVDEFMKVVKHSIFKPSVTMRFATLVLIPVEKTTTKGSEVHEITDEDIDAKIDREVAKALEEKHGMTEEEMAEDIVNKIIEEGPEHLNCPCEDLSKLTFEDFDEEDDEDDDEEDDDPNNGDIPATII